MGTWSLALALVPQHLLQALDHSRQVCVPGWKRFRILGGCQNFGPFLCTLNDRCCIIIGTQKGTIILTTTHLGFRIPGLFEPLRHAWR